MPGIQAELKPTKSIVPIEIADIADIDDLTDDECLSRLARAVAQRNLSHLDEVARLTARLVVTIE